MRLAMAQRFVPDKLPDPSTYGYVLMLGMPRLRPMSARKGFSSYGIPRLRAVRATLGGEQGQFLFFPKRPTAKAAVQRALHPSQGGWKDVTEAWNREYRPEMLDEDGRLVA